jgi:IclR family acetate operon transcriptional repressor
MVESRSAVPVRAVKKALDLLEVLVFERSWEDGATLGELATKMGMPRNSTHNLLKTMNACGYVAQPAPGRYAPGERCRQIGRLNRLKREALEGVLLPAMRALSEKLGEGVNFVTLARGRRVQIANVNPHRAVRVDQDLLEKADVYELVTGRALLAFAAPEDLEEAIARNGLPGARWDGMGSRESLDRALGAIRRVGHYAYVSDRHGTTTFAVPVRAAGGSLVGVLASYTPTYRSPRGRWAKVLKELKATTKKLAARLK